MPEAASLPRMDAETFLLWCQQQPDFPWYELWDGEVVSQVNERSAHALLKLEIAVRLREAVSRAGLDCNVYPDGMAVRLDDRTVYGPDCMLRCGPRLADDALAVADPMIVVEVLSPSTATRDRTLKLEGYMRIASLRHYLIVRTDRQTLIHHHRAEDGGIATRIVTRESVRLDPPGITLDEWWPATD